MLLTLHYLYHWAWYNEERTTLDDVWLSYNKTKKKSGKIAVIPKTHQVTEQVTIWKYQEHIELKRTYFPVPRRALNTTLGHAPDIWTNQLAIRMFEHNLVGEAIAQFLWRGNFFELNYLCLALYVPNTSLLYSRDGILMWETNRFGASLP